MYGSSMQTAAMPQLRKLAMRLLVIAVLVLWSLSALERELIEPLIPAFRAAIGALDGRFVITDACLSLEDSNETVRFRANLSRPLRIEGKELNPFGSQGLPDGGYQIEFTVGATLEYSSLLLIVVLAWPARYAREWALRLPLAVLLAALLPVITVPSTVIGELWHSVEIDADAHVLSYWLIWSRFLMGGGGLVLAVLFAGIAIGVGRGAEVRQH